MKTIITLNKKSNTNKILLWEGIAEDNKLKVKFGQIDGKLQTKEYIFFEGKNIGKSNETTSAIQCLMELETQARQKIEKNYTLKNNYTFTTINEKQVKLQNKSIPEPMLAQQAEKHEKKINGQEVALQPKLDGFRAIYSVKDGKFYSRTRKELNGCPKLNEELKSLLKDFDIDYLDGELYTNKLSFNEISSTVSPRKNLAPEENRRKIEYHIFDMIPTKKSFDFIFTDRLNVLKQLSKHINKKSNIKIVDTIFVKVTTLQETIKPIMDDFINKGFEGIMIRMPNSLYEQKRSYGIFKYKTFLDCEAKCIGFKAEEKNKNILGSIIFELLDGQTFDARPAMTIEQREEIWNNQKEYIGKIGVIKYQNLSEYKIPRFPVFTGKWRENWDISK